MANVYKIMDTTGDGRLSWKEIKAGFERINIDIAPSLLKFKNDPKNADKVHSGNEDDDEAATE